MSEKESVSRLHVRVTPSAPRNEVTGYTEGVLRVKVAAPPVKGQANKALIAFLAEILDLRKSQLSILKGDSNRDKVLAIEGVTQQQLELKLKSIQYS